MITPDVAALRKDPVALAQALIRCRSVTPDEGGALTCCNRFSRRPGSNATGCRSREAGTPDVDNLYARFGKIGTNGPHLCFAGHTDVVPPGDEKAWTHPPFAAVIENGVLWGRGAIDMKGAIACFAVAALDFIEQAWRQHSRRDLVPDHGRRGRPVDQRHGQGARLDEGERRAHGRLRRRRAFEPRCAGRRIEDRPARQPQRRAGRAWQAGPRRLSAHGREPRAEARAA